MKKSISLTLSILFSIQIFAQTPAENKVQMALKKLQSDAGLANGNVAFMAVNMDNGQVIADYNGGKSMTPASIQKLITTGVALEILGSEYQFKTTIKAEIDEESGAVSGDIYVFPSGDPTLQSKYYSSQPTSLDQIKEDLSSISSFSGSLIIDASGFSAHNTPRGWIWEDMGNYFGASPTPIIWRDNLLNIYLNTAQVSKPAILSSKTQNSEGLTIDLEVTASESNRDDAWFFSAPGSDLIYAKGTIPSNRTNFLVKASHPKPMQRFGNEILEAGSLKNKQVRIDYDYIEHTNLSRISTLVSPPLYSIVKMTNENSINLFAEALLVQLDESDRGKSTEGGIGQIEKTLSKQGPIKGSRFIDGSGLSPLNRLTCYSMLNLLTMMYRSKNKDSFINSLPIAGQSGTIKNSFTNPKLAGNMQAKSGTMTGVRNYAGYIKNNQGRTVAFCVMLNDYDSKRRNAIMQKLEDLMVAVVEN